MRKRPLWLRKTGGQLVAQWIARRSPSQWAESGAQRQQLQRTLCLELIFAIAKRVPDQSLSRQLFDLHAAAICGSIGSEIADAAR
ncbi:MAG: hypothetical protein ACOY45_15555 [Pseudomonadota bacterium]